MFKNKKAFTLIELLVVIAIIGILVTIAVIALNSARAKSRDAKRVADVKQVQTALELFYNDKNRYPTVAEFSSGSIYSTSSFNGTTTYMEIIPAAVTPIDGACTEDQNAFNYQVSSTGGSYTLSYCIGGPVGSIAEGPHCATPSGIAGAECTPYPADLTTAEGRNTQRLSDVQIIKDAMAAMYAANGNRYLGLGSNGRYGGEAFVNSVVRNDENCIGVEDCSGMGFCPDYNIPCPTSSDFCIKYTETGSPFIWGSDCDSGSVYLRNIPLNNYLPRYPEGDLITGVAPYQIWTEDVGCGSFYSIRYRLEGDSSTSATSNRYRSDHFLNGVQVTPLPGSSNMSDICNWPTL